MANIENIKNYSVKVNPNPKPIPPTVNITRTTNQSWILMHMHN